MWGGTINVVATIGCTGLTAAQLTLTTVLYKISCTPNCQDVAYGSPGYNSVTNKSAIQANSATTSCTSGQYFGVAYGTVTAPSGVTPPTGNLSGTGRTVSITC
jgi:hypothetical protein